MTVPEFKAPFRAEGFAGGFNHKLRLCKNPQPKIRTPLFESPAITYFYPHPYANIYRPPAYPAPPIFLLEGADLDSLWLQLWPNTS
jgi:hypothetical protein